MKILIVSQRAVIKRHCYKFKQLSQNPNVQVKILMPHVWKEKNTGKVFRSSKVDLDSNFDVLVYRSVFGHLFASVFTLLIDLWQGLTYYPDVIWVDDEPQGALLTKWIKIKKWFMPWVHVFCTARDPRFKQLMPALKKIEKSNFKRLSCAFSGSRKVSDHLLRKGFEGKLIEIPADLKFENNILGNEKLDVVRKKESLGLGSVVVGYIEPIVTDEIVSIIIKAVAKIPKNLSLIIIGEGCQGYALQKLIHGLGLSSRVKLVSDFNYELISEYLKVIDVLVDPVYDSMFWNELLEDVIDDAISMDIPLIPFKTGNHVITLDQILSDPEAKIQEIKENIDLALVDQAYKEELVQQSKKRVFDIEPKEFIQSTLVCLKSILK